MTASADDKTAFGFRDILKWLGHSAIAGLLLFLSLWSLVPDFDIWRSARFGATAAAAGFVVGLLYFGAIYVFYRMKSGKHES